MTVQHIPALGVQSPKQWVRYWRPRGSRLVMFLVNGKTRRPYTLLRWGDELYLPVREGDQPEVYIHNGYYNMWVATPAFLEGLNVYQGGPNQPELCTPDHMWEVKPGQYVHINGIHDPVTNQTRPIIIERFGQGLTIAEAVYHDASLRGQWTFYERWQRGFGTPPNRDWNDIHSVGYEPSVPSYWSRPYQAEPADWRENLILRGPARDVTPPAGDVELESYVKGPVSMGIPTRSTGRAGTGLGQAEHQASYETGVQYNLLSAKLALINVEFRHDLAEMFGWSNLPDEHWYWPMPDLTRPWWDSLPWYFDTPTGGIANDVPLAPHRPRRF